MTNDHKETKNTTKRRKKNTKGCKMATKRQKNDHKETQKDHNEMQKDNKEKNCALRCLVCLCVTVQDASVVFTAFCQCTVMLTCESNYKLFDWECAVY